MLARGGDFGARGEAREVRRGRCLEELEDEAMCDSLQLEYGGGVCKAEHVCGD